jgi:hypothetical protein
MSHRIRITAVILISLLALALTACGSSSNSGNGDSCANPVTSIDVTPGPNVTLTPGGTLQFTAVAKNAIGTVVTGVTVTWVSSATLYATIDVNGLATAVDTTGDHYGTTDIYATLPGLTCNGASSPSSTVMSNRVSLTVEPVTAASGTAATGFAIAGATVTLKDVRGDSRNAVTDAEGRYSIDTRGLIPPFLVQVQPTGRGYGHALYGVSADAKANTIINVDPLTDLIVHSWYALRGVSADAAFADPVTNPPPSAASVQVLNQMVTDVVRPSLKSAGVTDADFNLIATPFSANGTGMDAVLDQTSVNAATGLVTVSNGAITGTTRLTYDRSAYVIHVASTGQDGSLNSSDVDMLMPASQ